jgi:AraC-like DNA-binding protein
MNDADFFLPSQYIQQIADQITRMGARLPDWFQQLQEPGPTGELEVRHLSLADFRQLILDAIRLTGESAFGLLMGQRLLVNSHGMLGYVASQSVTPREALELIAQYFPLRTSLLLIRLELTHNTARLCFQENALLGDIATPVIEAIVLTIKNLFEYVTMGVCRPNLIAFTFEAPAYSDLAKELFECEVQYQASWNGFELSLAKLDNQVRTSNPKGLTQAIQRCQEELTRLVRKQGIASRVRILMLEKQRGLPSLQITARQLNLTPRTLHRRLIEEGTSYRDILESVRQQLAISHLRDNQLSLQELAFMLGYGDLANFRRAFKRWTGAPPSIYRRQLADSMKVD